MNIITVKNLIKRYQKADSNAVDDISFNVGQGDFFALLGPNGAGKTTAISILTTTLTKTSGNINIAGYDIDHKQNKIRASVGIIFQNPSLDVNLTAEENVRLHSVLYGLYSFRPTFGMMPPSYQKKVMELAHLLEIDNDIFKPIKTFSGGMKRKLEIIRSLVHKPKILFLDEPTSGLDPLSRKNLWEYLQQVRKREKTTIFLTTHYLDEAEEADQVCIINHGKIVAFGTPGEIKGELIEDYLLIGSKTPLNLDGELRRHKIPFVEENGLFRINLNGHDLQNIIKKIDTKLTSIKIHTPTLEEAYLEIINTTDEKRN